MAYAGSQSKVVVLVVEDETILRIAAVSFLEDAGFDVIEAEDADRAIALLEGRDDIRLLFTDIDLPIGSMNGLRLARAVRDRWPNVAIIMVSGHRVPDVGELPGGSKFFPKPYDETQMVSTVREMAQLS